jgi:hypothetical protein
MRGIDDVDQKSALVMKELVRAHATVAYQDAALLRTLGPRERGALIELACETAAANNRSRLVAGLPAAEPAPWPSSTRDFLRKHAARVGT